MKQLSITGGSGFLGGHLVSECLSRADIALRLLTRSSDTMGHPSCERVTLFQGDLIDPSTLDGFLQPDATLIHLAYLHQSGSANIEAAGNIARAALRAGVTRVVHCSTAVVVGFGAGGVITEDTPPSPRGEYQETKYAVEQVMRSELSPKVDLAILRPTEIIGPGGLGLREMIRGLASGPRSVNLAKSALLKSRRFNYVSVRNVVAALLTLALAPHVAGVEVYNISDDDDPDNNYAAVEEIVIGALGLPRHRTVDFAVPRSVLSLLFKLLPTAAPPDRVYSSMKIKSLGYNKVTTLRAAILDLITEEKLAGPSAVA